jgi:hypothetical protein
MSVTTEGGLPVSADKEPEPISLSASSAPGRTWSAGGVGTAGTLLHLGVFALVAIAISASFGEVFLLAVRANGTVAVLKANEDPPHHNFEKAPLLSEAGMPASRMAVAISHLSPAPPATASEVASSSRVLVAPPPPTPQHAPSSKIAPGTELEAGPSTSPGENAHLLPIVEQKSALSQSSINAQGQQESVGVDPPNRDEGRSPSVQSHSARSSMSHQTIRPGSHSRFVTHVAKKTRVAKKPYGQL